MTRAQLAAIAAVIRDARFVGPEFTAEDMRCYIARDLMRELRGLMHSDSFNNEKFFEDCDVPVPQRLPKS